MKAPLTPEPATTPDLVQVIAVALHWHSIGIDPEHGPVCICGEKLSQLDNTEEHQAKVVLDALTRRVAGFLTLVPDSTGSAEFADCMPTILPTAKDSRDEITNWHGGIAEAATFALLHWT